MVIEGVFSRADYTALGNHSTLVKMELMMTNTQLNKLQNALMNRRRNEIQLVVNSAEVDVADTDDTPKTTTESW